MGFDCAANTRTGHWQRCRSRQRRRTCFVKPTVSMLGLEPRNRILKALPPSCGVNSVVTPPVLGSQILATFALSDVASSAPLPLQAVSWTRPPKPSSVTFVALAATSQMRTDGSYRGAGGRSVE